MLLKKMVMLSQVKPVPIEVESGLNAKPPREDTAGEEGHSS